MDLGKIGIRAMLEAIPGAPWSGARRAATVADRAPSETSSLRDAPWIAPTTCSANVRARSWSWDWRVGMAARWYAET